MSTEKKPSLFSKGKNMIKEIRSELSKTVWPTWKQIRKNSLIVLASLVVAGIVIGLIDLIFMSGIDNIIKFIG